MAVTRIQKLTLLLLSTMTITIREAKGAAPLPANGDVRLEPIPGSHFYEVLVYYTDKLEAPSYGGICSSNDGVGALICRQLGYSYVQSSQRLSSHPVWLKNIDCDYHNVHILRCNHSVASGLERHNCNSSLLVWCDFSRPWYVEYFDGQIALCPSDNQTESKTWTSVSFGVISIQFNGTWKGVHFNIGVPLQSHEADTVCKQIGFTGAITGSAVASTASEYTFEKCYTRNHPFTLEHGAWLTSSNIHCVGAQDCLGCCYSYPTSSCSSCDNQIIIQCTFEPSEAVVDTKSTKSITACEVKYEENIAHCITELPTTNSIDLPMPTGDAQLYLCPPDATTYDKNITFGLILMYSLEGGAWRGLNQPDDHRLSTSEANTICRQLGFTRALPESILTRKEATNHTFDHCYKSSTSYYVQSGAWMTTKDLHCGSDYETCIRCCFEHTLSSFDCENCSDLNNIVIKCVIVDLESANSALDSSIEGLTVDYEMQEILSAGCNITAASCYQANDNQHIIITLGLSVGLGAPAILCLIAVIVYIILNRINRRFRNPAYANLPQ